MSRFGDDEGHQSTHKHTHTHAPTPHTHARTQPFIDATIPFIDAGYAMLIQVHELGESYGFLKPFSCVCAALTGCFFLRLLGFCVRG